jgi:hypothetical protein
MEEGPVSIIIEEIGGNCPVQAEGTIDGRRFYFRARGEHWSLTIHPTATEGYSSWPDDGTWYHQEAYGGGPFAAGWMEIEEAKAFIERGAALYRQEQSAGLHRPKQSEEQDGEYAPGTLGCHEALHMTMAFVGMVDDQICMHPAIMQRPEWRVKADAACQALWELYQAIGREHVKDWREIE